MFGKCVILVTNGHESVTQLSRNCLTVESATRAPEIVAFAQISWTVHKEDFVSDATGLSDALITQVSGHVAIDERGARVFPLSAFPDTRVVDASRGLINKHATSFPMERILGKCDL